jgi:hypothetical protein
MAVSFAGGLPAAIRALCFVALAGCGPAKTEPGTLGRPPADAVHSDPRPAMTITVDDLKTWSDLLARTAGSAAETTKALGLSGELARHAGYWDLTPPPPGTTRVMLVEGEGGIEYLEIQLAAPLTRGALDARFGEGRLLPRTGPGRPYKVAYHVAVPGAPFTCEVIAAFAEEPTTPATAAQSVVLRRDRA